MTKEDFNKEKEILHMTDNLRSQLHMRYTALEQLIKKKSKVVEHGPQGSIHVVAHSKRPGKMQYYLRTDPGEKNGKYLKKGNENLIRKIIQAEYDRKVLKTAEEEKVFIGKLLKHVKQRNLYRVFEESPDNKKEWIIPVIDSDEGFIEAWYKRYPQKKEKDEKHDHETNRHEWVRSKSEMAIANALDAAGIPYVYEYGFCDESGYWAWPDFLVLNPRTRKEYVWEHLGWMDNTEYVERQLGKIAKYEAHGYVQGKNLLFTYESKARPLRTVEIELLIKNFLV